MTLKIPTKECFNCHYRFPVTELKKKTISQNVGHSGMSASVGLTKNRNPRVHSGRQYYRKKTVFYCQECGPKLVKKDLFKLAFWGGLTAAMFWLFSQH